MPKCFFSNIYAVLALSVILQNCKHTKSPILDERDHQLLTIAHVDSATSQDVLVRHIELEVNQKTSAKEWPALLEPLAGKDTLLISLFCEAPTSVLDAELSGSFEPFWDALVQWAPRHKGELFLRWNPLPEIPVKDYPWQYQSPQKYIDAFRHAVAYCSQRAGCNFKWVYGAAGYPGALEYHPGDSYIDYNSVVLEPRQEATLKQYPQEEDLSQDLYRRLHRLRFSEKPIMVLGTEAQAAVSLSPSYWRSLKEAKALPQESDTYTASPYFTFGVYDPLEALSSSEGVAVEHLFLNWRDMRPFQKDLKSLARRDHDAIITVEPYMDSLKKPDPELLQRIVEGRYDNVIHQFYESIATFPGTIYLRFAHEMEIPIQRYPWQSEDPIAYIKAYRYFMNFDHPAAQRARKVWGPAGDRGSLEWYPGDDVVDFISVAIYGLPDKNIQDYARQESFKTILQRKIWRMRWVNRPIFITEFGIKGPVSYQSRWLKDAAHAIGQEPRVIGACYFNLHDNPDVWGEGLPAPDWSIEAASLDSFLINLPRPLQMDASAYNADSLL